MELDVPNINVPKFPDLDLLLHKIVELSDLGTLILVLMVFLLIALLAAERARSNMLTRMYISQSVEIVRVLTSVKNLMDGSGRILDLNASALGAVKLSIQEVTDKIELLLANSKRPVRRRKTTPKPKNTSKI